jgi:hypothetical protein
VIIDLLAKREPFYTDAYDLFLQIAERNDLIAYTSVKSIMDIYYILNRYIHDRFESGRHIVDLIKLLYVADSTDIDLLKSFSGTSNDLEDNLIIEMASRLDLDYIITRNLKDFRNSKVPAISPSDCLKVLSLPELDT